MTWKKANKWRRPNRKPYVSFVTICDDAFGTSTENDTKTYELKKANADHNFKKDLNIFKRDC